MSWPAGILIRALWRQVVTGSDQASTAYVHCPSEAGVTRAPHRSVPGASSRIGVQGPSRPAGSRRTTLAATASWPSRKTVAVTSNVSPATALAGLLPQSTADVRPGQECDRSLAHLVAVRPRTGTARGRGLSWGLSFLAAPLATDGVRASPLLSTFTRVDRLWVRGHVYRRSLPSYLGCAIRRFVNYCRVMRLYNSADGKRPRLSGRDRSSAGCGLCRSDRLSTWRRRFGEPGPAPVPRSRTAFAVRAPAASAGAPAGGRPGGAPPRPPSAYRARFLSSCHPLSGRTRFARRERTGRAA